MSSTNERENEIPTDVSLDNKSPGSNKKSKKSDEKEKKLKEDEKKKRKDSKEEKSNTEKCKKEEPEKDKKIDPDIGSERDCSSSKSSLDSDKDDIIQDISYRCSDESDKTRYPEEENRRCSKVPEHCNKGTQSNPNENQFRQCTCKEKERKESIGCDYKSGSKSGNKYDYCSDLSNCTNRGCSDGRGSDNSITYHRRLSHREGSTNILERSSGSCRRKEPRRDYNERKRCGECELCHNRNNDSWNERGKYDGREGFHECRERNFALMATIEKNSPGKEKNKEKHKDRDKHKEKEKHREKDKNKERHKEKDKKKKNDKSSSGHDLNDLKKDLMKLQFELDRLKDAVELIAATSDSCGNQQECVRISENHRCHFGGCVSHLSRLREKLRRCFLMRIRLCNECDNCESRDYSRNEFDALKMEVNSIKNELEVLKKCKK